MTWDAYHRRDTVLRDVMTVADNRRDGTLPWSEIDHAEDVFDTPTDLLRALQMRWHTRLSGAIERELTEAPWDPPTAVVHAWRALASEMPGVRMVLDEHADDEALRTARRKEWILLATAGGLTAMADAAVVRIGRRVEDRARAVTVVRTAPRPRPAHREADSWLNRLRHALPA